MGADSGFPFRMEQRYILSSVNDDWWTKRRTSWLGAPTPYHYHMHLRLIFLAVLVLQVAAVEVGPVPVVKVIDGDTIAVTVDGKEERVRLLYIDTPESRNNDFGGQIPEGLKAKEFLTGMLPVGSQIRLWGPKARLKRDKYDRLLAIVIQLRGADGNPLAEPAPQGQIRVGVIGNVNADIVRAGWSPYWRKYGDAPEPYNGSFLLAQNEADKEGAGLWSSNLEWIQNKANERTAPNE